MSAAAIDLTGRKGLVIDVSNERSLAWAAAQVFQAAGAELAVTYHSERSKEFVAPLAARVDAPLVLPCDVLRPGELEAVFAAIYARWGRLDFLFHSLAGALVTVSYYGAEKVVEHYNVMGPVMAAHEASVRYLAHELGPMQIRVNAISAGPVRTRAASGITHLEELLTESARRAAERRLATAEEVGRMALFLVSDLSAATTGEVVHVDAGFHVAGMVFH